MRIAVIGASKGVGANLAHQARKAGHDVTAVSRGLEAADDPHVTSIRGSILDPGVAERAVAGVDVVVWTAGSVGFGPAAIKTVTWLSEGTERIVAAMKAAGVRRLVVVTGIGAGDSRGHGGFLHDWIIKPLVVGAIYADKDRQEEIVRRSGLDWTIVRPGFLQDEEPDGRYKVLENIDRVKAGYISRGDCANFLLRCCETGEWVGKTVLVTD